MLEVDEALVAASARYDFVLVPGLYDSGPEHWQSLWQQRHPFWRRIAQRNWNTPDIELWVGSIRRLLAQRTRPAILLGHSFGALASCCALADGIPGIGGLMLVAPAEPSRFELEERVPERALGIPSVVVASHNDPVMRFPRAVHWAEVWGSELVDLGEAGHINVEAGFGRWPYGLEVLRGLVRRLDAQD